MIDMVYGGIGGGLRLTRGGFGGAPGKRASELNLNTVKTKPWPAWANGKLIPAVSLVAPFFSGDRQGRIRRSLAKSDNNAVVTSAMRGERGSSSVINVMTVPGRSLADGGQLRTDVFEPSANSPLDRGKLKTRPSVSMHIPGGKYSGKDGGTKDGGAKDGGKSQRDSGRLEAQSPGRDKRGAAGPPVLPWLSAVPGSTDAPAANSSAGPVPTQISPDFLDPQKPAKAIDENETTLEMSTGRPSGRQKAQDKILATERPGESGTTLQKIKESLSETIQEQAVGRDKQIENYRYVVQPGDTIESVARDVLRDFTLAALLFAMNRRYILPEEQYGIHPLMVGVVIQLPTPADVIKFRKQQSGQ